MMKKLMTAATLLLSVTCMNLQAGGGESRAWQEFKKAQKHNKETLLPDFSYAGYHHGETGIPHYDGKVFNVCDYGAVPDDHLSDREAVINAIRAAEAEGAGVIYFPKGRYDVHQEGDSILPIEIRCSNIVFRGDGCGAGGSEIFMEAPNRAVNPNEKWTTRSLFSFTGRRFASKITEVCADSRKGTFHVRVNDPSSLEPGDWVCLRLINNDKEVIARELAPYTVEDDWTSLLILGVQVYDYHQIVSVDENTVTFKEPLMREVRADENWEIYEFPVISEVGVEDLAFVGNWKEKFVHHKNDIHDGGWKFIEFKNVVNSWVTRCRFTDVCEAVNVNTSANVTVADCSITGNIGHNSVHAIASSRSFLGAINDYPSMWHTVGVAKQTIGTVVWRCYAAANSCFESHASQPRATLFDVCEGGFMRGRAGGAIMNNPNHLNDLILWNYKETDKAQKDFDFWAKDTRYWRVMPPIIIGFHGAGTTFLESQVKYQESTGRPVKPESLYEAQLRLRLGKLPEWLVKLKKKVAEGRISGQMNE